MSAPPDAPRFDPEQVRADFPILSREGRGGSLVYLDSAATSQKPGVVMDALSSFYEESNANVHRGVYELSEKATHLYEGGRETIRRWLGAKETAEVIFVRGTTEAINLIASSWGHANVGAGDEVLVTEMEHHSNIVPWQMLCQAVGARLVKVPVDERGQLEMATLAEMLRSDRSRVLAITHVSNALGSVNPIEEICAMARAESVVTVVDGAQAVPHFEVDVAALGCDFYAMSGHKAFGPTGIGVLYGRRELLEAMPPYQGGGDMILSVQFDETIYNELPYKFEAGTPNIAGTVGLAAAAGYLLGLDRDAAGRHEADLMEYAGAALAELPGLRMIGTAEHKAGAHSFVLDGIHAHDVGTILDDQGVAVRVGHHCAQPVLARFGVPATVRASVALYNNREDIDRLMEGLRAVRKIFG